MEMLRKGSKGDAVEALQKKLLAMGINPGGTDGSFGSKTEDAVKRFQEREGLEADGIVGSKTLTALGMMEAKAVEAVAKTVPMEMLRKGSKGDAVEALQKKLLAMGINPGSVDGIFGSKTEDAVKRFQERKELTVDGIVGPKTFGALGIGKTEVGKAASQASTEVVAPTSPPVGGKKTGGDTRSTSV
jgi:peptidoglycan hydrolase-like protein with peptidoglycan-binding domain